MATAALVNHDIDVGRRIVAALTRAAIPVSVYLWAFIPQLQEWQFMIATPLVDTRGPRAAYGEVDRALQREGILDEVPLRRIFLKSPSDKVLRSLERESKAVSKEAFRVVNEQIGGDFVEDAYLYTGTIHVLVDHESGPEAYLVFYAPNLGTKRGRMLLVNGIESLRLFLEKKVHLSKNSVAATMKDLGLRNGVSIPNLQLKQHDLRRLGLA
jgi:hypothetical protein